MDRIISSIGLVIAVCLLLASIALFWAYHFVHTQVHDQLAAEKITFPAAGSPGLLALPQADRTIVARYAGQQLVDG